MNDTYRFSAEKIRDEELEQLSQQRVSTLSWDVHRLKSRKPGLKNFKEFGRTLSRRKEMSFLGFIHPVCDDGQPLKADKSGDEIKLAVDNHCLYHGLVDDLIRPSLVCMGMIDHPPCKT